MILGGKLPGKVGRCRFFIARKANTTVNIAPFRESTVSHDHNGVAAGEETVKLAGEPARYMDVAGFLNIWLHGQAVKTPPFHGGNRGSIPL